MSDTFKNAIGRKVVSRTTAEGLGPLTRLCVDANERQISLIVLGKGRKATILEWKAVAGFGPDAVMIHDEQAGHPPTDDADKEAVDGKRDLLGARALTELGNELGTIDDIEFDPATGQLISLQVGAASHPAGTLLGLGSYAAILDKTTDPE